MPRKYKIPSREFIDAHPFKINEVYCKLIPLTQGLYSIVDEKNYQYLSQWNWYARWAPNVKSFYATRMGSLGGKRIPIQMHRVVLGLSGRGVSGDHKRPYETLTNTEENLRPSSICENGYNSRKRIDNTSGYKGVTFHKLTGKYESQIRSNGKRKHLGLRSTAYAAFWELYVPAALKLHGNYANLG